MSKLKDYNELVELINSKDPEEREEAIISLNRDHCISISQIAKLDKSSHYIVRKIFSRRGVEIVSNSELARKQMLETDNHPTKGRHRTEDEKIKMGAALSKGWKDTSDARKDQIEKQKKRIAKNPGQMKEMSVKGSEGLRKAAKNGSRLEHYLREKLAENGFVSIQHRDKVLPNERFEFDLFIREMGIIIEVDGPTHFEPVFGDESLNKSLSRDQLKTKLAIEQGYKMVRVKQFKGHSQHYFREIFNEVLKLILDIKNGLPGKYFSIEVK